MSPPFNWLRSLFCVNLFIWLQTLGIDLVVCIYNAFMARVSVSVSVSVRVWVMVVMLGVRVIVVMLGVMARVRVNG